MKLDENQVRFLTQCVDLLGRQVKDRVTGAEGVVTSIGLDLYGCAQAVVTPRVSEKDHGSHWYDVNRLSYDISAERVMPAPSFRSYVGDALSSHEHGASDKPPFQRHP